MWLALRHAALNLGDKHMASGRMNQENVTAVRVPPQAAWAPGHHFVPLSFLLFFSHSRTCRPAVTRSTPKVLGDAGTRLQYGMARAV